MNDRPAYEKQILGAIRYQVPCGEDSMYLHIPKPVQNSVIFVKRKNSHGQFVPAGTAFVINVQRRNGPKTPYGGHWYIVTARHVILQASRISSELQLRINTTDGGSVTRLETTDDWFYHPTEESSVDVAIKPFDRTSDLLLFPVNAECLIIQPDEIEWHFCLGTQVMIPGLFSRLTGNEKNVPIIRTGNIALMPNEEKIRATIDGANNIDMEAYLVEVRSTGGISGAPVFAKPNMYRTMYKDAFTGGNVTDGQLMPWNVAFMGLVHGHWEIEVEDQNETSWKPPVIKSESSINVGVAIVVPAKKILEVLRHTELETMRKKKDDEYYDAEGTTTPDSTADVQDVITKKGFQDALKQVSRKLPAEESSQPDEGKSGT